MNNVRIYTDGGCYPNPGNGAFCVIVIYNEQEKLIAGYRPNTTNNRMELLAVVVGLSVLKQPCNVTLYSDSKYTVDTINSWIYGWHKKNWMRSKTHPVKNLDLIQKIWELIHIHKVNAVWVKGHNGNHYNEKCDRTCSKMMKEKLKTYIV